MLFESLFFNLVQRQGIELSAGFYRRPDPRTRGVYFPVCQLFSSVSRNSSVYSSD